MTFSEAVIVNGSPRLPLGIGSNTRHAGYTGIDTAGMVLSFSYTVVDGDQDLDGFTVDKFALELNGATITGTTGVHNGVTAVLTHTGVAAHEDHRVNLPPLITGVEVTSTPQATNANDTYGLGEDIEITVTFSEAVNVTGDVDFGLSVSGVGRAPLARGNGTTELVFAYTVQATDDDDNGIWIGDHTHPTNPTFDLEAGQSVVGAVSSLDALLEHDEVGQQNDHKVDGSLTGADATLSALSLSGITLDQTFTAGATGSAVTSFTATTSLSSTVVTATASQSGGSSAVSIDPGDADANTTDHEVNLNVGDTVITVEVTSTNGDSTRTYTVTVTRQVVTDSTSPSASSAKVSADGMSIDVVFDEDLDATVSAPAALAFEVTVDGGTAVNPTSVAFHASDADTITLTMGTADTIAAGETVTVAYTKPASNALADAASNEVATFTGQAAPNRPAAPVVTLTVGDGKLTASWTAPANGGSAITGYDVEWKTASQTWAQAATAGQSATAAATATTHEITGLTNGIEHTVRVRAANDAGDGPWSAEASATPGNNDADLSALTVDGTGVDGFAAGTTSYTVTAAHDTTRVTVAATLSDSNAGVEYSPADADTSAGATGHQVDLAGGKTAVTVTVTAEDKTTTKVYTVNFHRPVVPHDWSLRPDGVPTGETFRVLIVTSTTRDAESGDIAVYDAHVRSALARRGHVDIEDYGPLFKALAATAGGAAPKSHTDTDPDDDMSEEIWWLNGPKAADDYADFYDRSWDHSNPARTEAGDKKTFTDVRDGNALLADRLVWTGTRVDGTPSSSVTLGHADDTAGVGSPYTGRVWRIAGDNHVRQDYRLGLYGLSAVMYIEPPDSPYATIAEITSAPENGADYLTGETITATVTFSEAVIVNGSPRLPLGIGSNTRHAGYTGIDTAGMVLSFSYTVVDGDQDLDGFTVDKFALELNGATITGTTGVHNGVTAVLTHTGVAAHEDHRVNLPPLITGVEVTSTPQATNANDTYGLGEDIEITVTFSEAVNVTGDVDFGLSVSGVGRAPLARGNGTTELVFAYTVQATDDDDNGIWIGDHTHPTNPTFDLEAGQSVVGAVSSLDALLEHDEVGQQNDHKVDGSLTGADATLSALSLSGITLDQTFTAGATGYTATTSLSSTTVTIGISQGQNGATGRIAAPPDADLNESGHQVTLDVGDTTIRVTVTSSNADSTRTYTVTVTREAATDTTAPEVDSARVVAGQLRPTRFTSSSTRT